jgi:YspA, cpYpsA-related SLOG family
MSAVDADREIVLVCGSRRWPHPATVHAALDRLLIRHGERLVIVEGAARGADWAAHCWCLTHGWNAGGMRHRCYPVDWRTERRNRPETWHAAGRERNTRMLLIERPRLIIAFHHDLDLHASQGGTLDMIAKALVGGVPSYHVAGRDLAVARWLRLKQLPEWRREAARRELAAA